MKCYQIKLYSNYDCCNSFDNPKTPQTYLHDVYSRVKAGVRRADFEYEFYNGAYGGALFIFVFKSDKENIEEIAAKHKAIIIPKDTQFGFTSASQCSASIFEKTTYRTFILELDGKTKFDRVAIEPDDDQYYSLKQIFGDVEWVDEINLEFVGEK